MAQQSSATTKSIDVGGVFLMDLSVSEAFEPSESLSSCGELAPSMAGPFEIAQQHHQRSNTNNNTHNHRAQPSIGGQQQIYDTTNSNSNKPTSHNPLYRSSQPQPNHYHQDKSIRLSPTAYEQYGGTRRAPQALEPLECGLASVINCDRQQHGRSMTTTTTTARPYELDVDEEEEDLSSLSDESYLPTSSGTSLSVSLTGSATSETDGYGGAEVAVGAEQADELDKDKESTTTREDSGVLDMKDLGGGSSSNGEEAADKQQQVPRSLERDHQQQQHQQQQHHEELLGQEKSISANIMATNLINKTANGNTNFHHQATNNNNNINYNKQQQQQPMQQSISSKPTDGVNNYHQTHHITHNNHNQQQTVTSSQAAAATQRSNARGISTAAAAQRPPVSASLPIQVPARQMKKNLNRMKLKLRLMKDSDDEASDEQQPAARQQADDDGDDDDKGASQSPPMVVRCGDRNRPALENIAAFCGQTTTVDDDVAFLNQEFNANHHNHYPIDELDSEHLTAEEDPMRLFASIQALAKSLHEDAELFGSLPPKRMLESPIRSLALV